MKLFPKRTPNEKRTIAKKELMISIAVFAAGCVVWAVSFLFFPNTDWLMIAALLLAFGGVYLLVQTIFGLMIDLTVGYPAFFIGFAILILAGGLMTGYQLIIAP